MWLRWYCDKDVVTDVLAALQEFKSMKASRLHQMLANLEDNEEAKIILNSEAKDDSRITRIYEQFAEVIRYHGETEATENEKLAAIRKFMNEVLAKHTGGRIIGQDIVKEVKGYFKGVIDEKEAAYATFATLADDMRVKLLAVQFLLEDARTAATHRAKNEAMDSVLRVLTTIIENLGRVDKNHPESYRYNLHRTGSWDYAQTLAEMHHQKSELEMLRQENETLKAGFQAMEKEVDRLTTIVGEQDQKENDIDSIINPPVKEDEIPF